MQVRAQVTLARDGRYVAVARGVLGTLLDGLPVPREVVDDLQTALGEACANVVRHATGSDAYEVDLQVDEDACVVQVRDRGPGFLPSPAHHTPGRPEAEGGRGLALIRALTDHVEFERAEDGMRIRFKRAFQGD